jgi:hypothetical protein
VELFSTFNDAIECQSTKRSYFSVRELMSLYSGTENAYLRAWFRAQKVERSATIFRELNSLETLFLSLILVPSCSRSGGR